MTAHPLTDIVSGQYEKWVYPEPIRDLPAWLTGNWQWFDPSHAHRLLWPGRDYQPGMDILIAGCGTSQAAVFAYTNPGARVVAIDVSQSSLDHHAALKNKYGLENLTIQRLPIEEVAALERDFDLVISTGVLHHLADPSAGLKALANCLRRNGVAAIMLYARYGRTGVELMQAVFREMGLRQDEESLAMVKAAVNSLDASHPLRSYMSIAPDLGFDAGIVDTFLHGRDRSYTVDDCVNLVSSAGLVFQNWFLNKSYYPPTLSDPSNEFFAAINRLPAEKMWSVMERVNTLNACHFFMATHPERPTSSYRIDFASPQALDSIPLYRLRCGIQGQQVFRPGGAAQLAPRHLAFMRFLDGEHSIREIVQRVSESGVLPNTDQVELESIGLELVEQLWRGDFIALDLSGAKA